MDFLRLAVANTQSKLKRKAPETTTTTTPTTTTTRTSNTPATSTSTSTCTPTPSTSSSSSSTSTNTVSTNTVSLTSSSSSSSSSSGPKQFKTRGQIEAERQAEKQKEKELKRLHNHERRGDELLADEKKQLKEAETSTPSQGSSSSARVDSNDGVTVTDSTPMISVFEVQRRLRGYSEPISLFGETSHSRWERLKLYELNMHDKQMGARSMGRGNAFHEILQSEVQNEIAADILAELEAARNQEDTTATTTTTTTTTSDDPTAATADGTSGVAETTRITQAVIDAPAKIPKPDDDDDDDDTTGGRTGGASKKPRIDYKNKEMRRSDFPDSASFIMYFYKRMLSEWEADLESRPKEVKRSVRGKVDSATQKQTRQYIKPFFKLLKTGGCDSDIIKHTENIAIKCLERDYIAANEAYMLMAIGDAPWPIGVTMVSIHERAGRGKIYSGNIARKE